MKNNDLILQLLNEAIEARVNQAEQEKKKPEPVKKRKPHPLATVFKVALIIGALAFFANAMS